MAANTSEVVLDGLNSGAVTFDLSDGLLLANGVSVQVLRTELEQLLQDSVVLYDGEFGCGIQFDLGLVENLSLFVCHALRRDGEADSD